MQQQILDALQALIVAGATVAGSAVYVDRIDPLPRAARAAVLIREGQNGDDVQPGSIKDVQERTLDVEIVCFLRACDDVAAQARDFGLAVEKLVSPGNDALRALCKGRWRLTNSRLVPAGEGEEALASRVLAWQFVYYTRKGAPDVPA